MSSFSFTGAEQRYTIPSAGDYKITATGAGGGKGNTFSGNYNSIGGKGAQITANFSFNAGDVLIIIVGGKGSGSTGTSKDGASGGGGGGTFVFREIPSITDSRYQFQKGSKYYETLLVAAGGGGAWDESYKGSQGNGYDGIASAYKSPSNYTAWSATTASSTSSVSVTSCLGISQYISNDLKGTYYTRNGSTGQGGYGGGSATDDSQSYGGGWSGSGYVSYSWSLDSNATGQDGANADNGSVSIEASRGELRNLIPDPLLQLNGWAGATYDTAHHFVSNRSIKLTGTTATPEVVIATSDTIPLVPNHIYYARMYGWQNSRTNASVGFYWPIAEPSFQEGIPIGDANKWNLYSGRTSRTSFSPGGYQLRLDFNNAFIAGTIYIDGVMLLDLTAAFGAGFEPDKDTCDKFPYFADTLDVITTQQDGVESIVISPNPVIASQKIQITVTMKSGTGYAYSEPRYSGEFYAGEV